MRRDGTRPQHAQGAEAEEETQEQKCGASPREERDPRGASPTLRPSRRVVFARRPERHPSVWSSPHLARATSSSQERAERKRKAKEERRTKVEPVLRDDGDKKCKICKEVSAPARTTPQPGTAAAATARPCATNRRLTHPSSSFPSPGFANLEVLAGAALQTQGGVQKLLRVQGPGRPPGPRPEEQVHEGASRGAQAAQGDEEEGEGRGEGQAGDARDAEPRGRTRGEARQNLGTEARWGRRERETRGGWG